MSILVSFECSARYDAMISLIDELLVFLLLLDGAELVDQLLLDPLLQQIRIFISAETQENWFV